MDMEHQLLHLEHFMPSSPGFFAVDDSSQHPAHFPDGGLLFVEQQVGAAATADDGGWVEDLMQLGEELFSGQAAGGDDDVVVNGTGAAVIMGDDDHFQQWQWQCDDDDGGSPDGGGITLDGGGGGDPSPPSVEQDGAGELAHPHREDAGDDVSGATTRKRRDRSKTIVSERKRRVRMKEKLYELRSLVPNITKMDKASIIADAVVYVKNLQAHARKLKEEVAALEARPRSPTTGQEQPPPQHSRRAVAAAARRRQQQQLLRGAGSAGSGGAGRVTRVDAAQVGDGRFFVTVECERRDGVAAPLCAAAESLACFRVESSSVGRSGPDRVVSTLTLKASQQVGDAAIGESSVKLWMMAALLKEGFRPEATVQIS